MDVFVIPIDNDRYELYCEPTVDAGADALAAPQLAGWGWLGQLVERWRLRFVSLLSAAERGELLPEAKDGWLGRLQTRITGWVAERIAEQRLLWRLRSQSRAVAVHPEDMTFEQVRTLVMRTLQRDSDRHRLWLIIDAVGMILSWPLVVVPGPNLILYYFMVRVAGHWFSMSGARQGLQRVAWSGRPCPSLGELRGAAALDPASRERRVRDVAAHLRLQHLSTFFERVAVPACVIDQERYRARGRARSPCRWAGVVKLSELAERLGCRLEGDGTLDITRVSGIQDAGPGDVTFLANSKYERLLGSTRASAVILRDDAPPSPAAALRTADPYLAFARAVRIFAPEWRPLPGIHELTVVAPTARLGADVSVGPFVCIGEGATIGDRTVIFPHVTIGPDAVIGADCVIHSRVSIRERIVLGQRVVLQDGAVIGSDGFGFARRGDGTHEKIPQVATVVIEDDVEIGANTTVDRPAVGETRVRQGTKIDNLVQIAHGVSVGRNVLMAAQVGVAGSTEVHDGAVLGGQAGITGHITIERGAVVAAHAGVTNSVAAGTMVAGYPAIESREWRRSSAVFRRLPELKRRVEALEAAVRALTGGSSSGNDEDPA